MYDTTLRFTQVLQTTLDLAELLDLFQRELAKLIPYDSLSYRYEEKEIDLSVGEPAAYLFESDLTLLQQPLGSLRVTRDTAFSEREQALLQDALQALLYPLRHAILYKKAIDDAFTDPVSGTNNRAAMDVALAREIDLAERHGTSLSLVLLDIDKFKDVNDHYGHLAGDAVLRELGDRAKECMRRSDIVFRYGGEEFVVILSNTGMDGAALLAHRLRKAVANRVFKFKSSPIKVTISIGIATLPPKGGPREIIEAADKALYLAKKQGRNKVAAANVGLCPEPEATVKG